MKILIYIMIFGFGVAMGCFLMALLAANANASDYEEGYRDGYQKHKGEELDNFTEVCTHCAYRGH